MYVRKEEYKLGALMKITRNNPCPICGKPDYCFWKEREDDHDLYNLYCNRRSEAVGTIVAGLDGKDYVSIFLAPNRTIFESVIQREERTKRQITGEKKVAAPRTRTVLDSVEPLPHELLDEIYRCMLDELPLYKYHAQYLLNEGWNLELLQMHHIRSFPAAWVGKLPESLREIPSRELLAKRVMRKLGLKSLAGVPGAFINEKGNWTFTGKSGMLLPIYDSDGLIFRLRLRLDFLDLPVEMKEDQNGFYYMDMGERVSVTMGGPSKIVNGEKIKVEFEGYSGKYRNFSSYKLDNEAYQNGFISNIYNKGCEAGNQILFAMNPQDDYHVFWVIEGEKKALFSNYILHQPFLGKEGVNDFMRLVKKENGKTALDIMRQKGAKIAILADDADRYQNENVMRCQNGLADLLKSEGFKVMIADWNMKDGKGLDDLLASGHLPALYEYK